MSQKRKHEDSGQKPKPEGFAAEAPPPEAKGRVEQASIDSFPASDPPGYNSVTRVGDPKGEKKKKQDR